MTRFRVNIVLHSRQYALIDTHFCQYWQPFATIPISILLMTMLYHWFNQTIFNHSE